VINDRPTSLVNLLTWIPNARCLVADDSLMSMIWCDHGFQRRKLNFEGKFVHFKRLWSKKNLKNFQIKVGNFRDWTNVWKSCKKLA